MQDHKLILARAIEIEIEFLGDVASLKLNSYFTIGEMLENAKKALIGYKKIYVGECLIDIERAHHRLADNLGIEKGITWEQIYRLCDLHYRIRKESKLIDRRLTM